MAKKFNIVDTLLVGLGLYMGTTLTLAIMKPNMNIPDDPIEVLEEQEARKAAKLLAKTPSKSDKEGTTIK